jgi:curli biogenesis system outer membrane secretion channel CsgG
VKICTNFYVTLCVVIIALSACTPDPFKQNFESAKLLLEQKKVGEAYPILKDLCAKSPSNEEYCARYSEIRKNLYEEDVKRISAKISSLKAEKPLLPVAVISELTADVKKLEGYEMKTQELENLALQVNNEKKLTEGKIGEVIAKAKDLFAEKKYKESINLLGDISYLDADGIGQRAGDYREKAMQDLYPSIQNFAGKEDWGEAKKLLETAYAVNPDYKNVKQLLKEAQEKDNVEYDLKKAEDAKKARKYDIALKHYEKAMDYPESKDRVQMLYHQTKLELCDFYFQAGIELMEQDLNKQAFDNFKKAYEIIESMPIERRKTVKIPKKELQKYFDSLYLKAKKAEDSDALGVAYQFYRLIGALAPTYPDIRENIRKTEEKIANRGMKSMAVIPFKSPKSAPEAGGMFISNVMLALYNELRQDMKIIERESMDVLLREYELTMAGKGADKPKDAGSFQISSAEYLLMGDVLDYRVDSSVQEGNKIVRVKTRVEFLANPEYDDWVAKAKKLEQEGKEIPPSPPKLIEKPFFEDIKYKVSYYKKVGILSISYRIVDTSKGKILHTGMIDIKKDANDEASEGIEIGELKIPFKIAQLPTDTELIKKAQEEAIAKIIGEIKNLFKDPEDKCLKQAELLEKDGNIKEAIERYSDALVLLKRKKLDAGAAEIKINKYLDVLSSM